MNTTKAGNQAETKVAEFLSKNGFEIKKRNWRTPYAEIDIVAEKDKCLYFVEVKYRTSDEAGDGFDYITSKKLRHMRRAAESWVIKSQWTEEYMLMAASIIGELDDCAVDLRELI